MSSNAASSTAPISESRADIRYTPSPPAMPAMPAHLPDVAVDLSNAGKEATLTVHANPHSFDSLHSPHPLSAYSSDSAGYTTNKPPPPHSHHQPDTANVLKKQLSAGFDTTFFEFNDASSLTQYFIGTAIAKAHSAVWPRFVSGLLSGLFVVFGAVFALVAAGGISADTRAASPAIPHIISGLTFPIALVLIMFVGGDLFTGNCMYVGVGLFSGRITLRQALNVLLVSFFSNLCGCLFFSYFLGYRTGLFTAAPYNSWVLAVANGKVGLDWGEVVLRGIGANTLVCIGIFMGSSSRTALGRLVIAWIPVMVFSIIGYEHVVANMAFIPIAMMYGGTNFNTAQYIGRSMVPSAIGNLIGGGIMLGGFLVYLYNWKGRQHASSVREYLRYNFVPDSSVGAVVREMGHQFMHDLPIEK